MARFGGNKLVRLSCRPCTQVMHSLVAQDLAPLLRCWSASAREAWRHLLRSQAREPKRWEAFEVYISKDVGVQDLVHCMACLCG